MPNFHIEMRKLINFDAWNNLPSAEKKSVATPRNNTIDQIVSSFLKTETDSTPTFQEFATKVVDWISSHADSTTKEDTNSLKKLKVILLSRLPQNDKSINTLKELIIALQTTTDHAANISHTFDSVTRYLPNRNKLLATAAVRVKEGEALCKKLKKSDWATIVKDYEQSPDNLPIDGLKAFYDGKITMEQFSTLVFCWSLIKQFPGIEIQTQPLFDAEGGVNRVAEGFIRQTLESCGVAKGQPAFFNEKKFNIFLKNMRLQHESESTFFFIKTDKHDSNLDDKTREEKILAGTRTITEEIYSIGVNVFNQFEHEGTTYRMIPSLGMMQQFLAAYAGDIDAVKIIPVIGLSSVKDILKNAVMDTRDMALPFPGVELPKEADMLMAPKDIDFIGHDFYHSILASDVTHEHRRAFAAYANAILESKKQSDNLLVRGFLDQLYERIIDMEHPAFRQNFPNLVPIPNATEAQKFLYMLAFQQNNTRTRLLHMMCKAGTNTFSLDDDNTKYVNELGYAFLKQKVIEKLADILYKQNFCLQYSITLEDLEPLSELTKTTKTELLDRLKILENLSPFVKNLMQEIELGGEKMTVLEFSKKVLQEFEKTDIPTQLFVRMSGKKSTNTDKDSPTVEPGLVHRRIVIFEKITELTKKMRTGS